MQFPIPFFFRNLKHPPTEAEFTLEYQIRLLDIILQDNQRWIPKSSPGKTDRTLLKQCISNANIGKSFTNKCSK